METLIRKIEDGVAWIQFHRPDVRNAVNHQMMEELELLIDEFSQSTEIKVIVFSGNEQAFVSGGDVREFHQLKKSEDIYPVMAKMGKILDKIAQLDQLTIAAVEGPAMGGGFEIVTSCDWCIATPRASFGMIQVGLGITTGWGGAHRLLAKIGKAKALNLLLTGKRISGEEAYLIGVVDQVVEEGKLLHYVKEMVSPIARSHFSIFSSYKQIARLVEARTPTSELAELEARACSICWEHPEHEQAVERFLRK